MAKEGIHPNYREVLFLDLSNGFKFVTRSCVNTKETVKHDDGKALLRDLARRADVPR